MHMKQRITLTIDPEAAQRAKKLARARRTSVSGLVQDLLNSAPLPQQAGKASIAEKWLGKLTLKPAVPTDVRMTGLRRKYGLDS